MTDNEIIKALKTLLELVLYEGCQQRAKTISLAIDFINRQKAEIERLQRINSELGAELDDLKRDDLPRCKDALRRANEIGMGLEKENQELRAEIERLKGKVDMYEEERKYHFEMSRQRIAEAIKEFAELVKRNHGALFNTIYSKRFGEIIDNLVKEMVGGNDG